MPATGRLGAPDASEREHVERVHHEICTALTVFCSHVELVRIQLRETPLAGEAVQVHAHLAELEGAADRLRDIAHELKLWHDGLPPKPAARAPAETPPAASGEQPAPGPP